jgi:ribokinase
MNKAHIISLGSINVDIQVRAPRWPEPGETLLVSDYLLVGGGKGANVAYIARRLGATARLLGRIGDDLLAEEALRPLRAIGVDISATRQVVDQATGTALIVVRPDGEKTILLAANANEGWTEAETREVAAAVRKAPPGSVLVVDLEIDPAVALAALAAAKERSLGTVLDPSPADRMGAGMYRLAGCLTPNPAEAEQLTGIGVDTPEAALRAGRVLRDKGVETALMKLGAGGCVVVSRDGAAHLPAPEVPVVDTTGAGDGFAGALAVALLQARPLREAVRFAVTAASLAVTRYGSQAAYPTLAEVERLLMEAPEAVPVG